MPGQCVPRQPAKRARKKLIEAARWWASAGKPEHGAALTEARALLANLREWNAPPEQIDPVLAEISRLESIDRSCEVHEDNWDAVLLFVECESQWRWVSVGLGGLARLGLDYTAVESVMRMRGVRRSKQRQLLTDLQLMEQAAMVAFSARTEPERT